MKTLLFFALILPLSAQSNRIVWDSVKLREGDKLFDLLHGRYMALDLAQTSPSLIGPTVSFSPQGAAVLEALTGRRIPGIGIHDLIVCSPTGAPVISGSVYQLAVTHGVEPIAPAQARALFRRTASRSVWSVLFKGVGYAAIGVPILGQAKVVSMSSQLIFGMLSGHGVIDLARGDVQAQIPDPGPLLAGLLDPESVLSFAGTCRESRMVTVYHKNPVSGTFLLQ